MYTKNLRWSKYMYENINISTITGFNKILVQLNLANLVTKNKYNIIL